jgi:primosomal protein N' (replication factor Y)
VLVDTPLLHLDRAFDYEIPAELAGRIEFGARVKIKFGGRSTVGWVTGFSQTVERPERIAPILDVVGDIPLLTHDVLKLARICADRWIGTCSDIVRSAIPTRQVRVESAVNSLVASPWQIPSAVELDPAWDLYAASHSFLQGVSSSVPHRAALCVTPGDDAFHLFAQVLVTSLRAHRGVIAVLPDNQTVQLLQHALASYVAPDEIAVLTADVGASQRFRTYLRVLRGEVGLVIGTRSAAFAPVQNLGLVAVYDDGDDSLAEQQAPYWNARDVLAIRAREENLHYFTAGFARSVETQYWIETGWLQELNASRDYVRSKAPLVRTTNDAEMARDPLARLARLPHLAFATIREGLKVGPVLISVPRRGYQLNLACGRCRERAACPHCAGPLGKASQAALPHCLWCGAHLGDFSCRWCQFTEVRSIVVGAGRTAEELGRAFPDTVIRTSGKDHVVAEVDDTPALVIATPGAEPRVTHGAYAAAVILDAELPLNRMDLRAHEETLRRWLSVVSLVKPESGRLAIIGDESHPVVQALVRHDPIGFAQRELQTRKAARVLPVWSVAEVVSTPGIWSELKPELDERVQVLGPVPYRSSTGSMERTLVCSPRAVAGATAHELRAMMALRSSKKAPGTLHIRIDPVHLT